MTKSKMKEICNKCKEDNNGWCKDLETNNIDIKISNCMYNTNDYFVYKLVEELKKRGVLR